MTTIPGTIHEVLSQLEGSVSLSLPEELLDTLVTQQSRVVPNRKRARDNVVATETDKSGTPPPPPTTTTTKDSTESAEKEDDHEDNSGDAGAAGKIQSESAKESGEGGGAETKSQETGNADAANKGNEKNDTNTRNDNNDQALSEADGFLDAISALKKARTDCQTAAETQHTKYRTTLQKLHSVRALYLHGLEQVSSLTDMRKAPDAYLA